MTRFNIIGRGFLDIETGNAAGFKKTNPWFCFCDVQLGRSVEFTVPGTTHNRTLLGFGDDPSEYGEQLRTRHECQLVYDGGQVMGTLAVTAWSGDAFSCVFLVGGSSWIDRLQDMPLSDCVSALEIQWKIGVGADVDTADLSQPISQLKYENVAGWSSNLWGALPAVKIKPFIQEILGNLGVPHTIAIDPNYYMIASTLNGSDMETVKLHQGSPSSVTQTTPLFATIASDIEWATAMLFGAFVGGGSNNVSMFVALQNVEVTFPASMPNDCFLIKYDTKMAKCETLGGKPILVHPFTTNLNTLDGATVQMKAGDIFFFSRVPAFDYAEAYYFGRGFLQSVFGIDYFGFKASDFLTIDVELQAAQSTDIRPDEYWRMRYNMPDMTVFEFLKSVCLATGLELTVDPIDGIKIDNGVYGPEKPGHFKKLERVLSIDRVARTAWGDDTAVAAIAFDSDDYVTTPIRAENVIANENNGTTREWVSKFSEGEKGDKGVLIEDCESGTYKLNVKHWTIVYAKPTTPFLQRVTTPSHVGYDDIAANSTAVTVKALLPLADFFAMKPSTTWLWRGCAYLWSEASWSDGVLTMEMQRVSAERVEMLPPPPTLTSIEAVFTQPQQPIIGTDNLDDLKQWLTVTATFSDSSTRVLDANEYTLSGTLAYPSATVTVDYQGETDTFSVAVAYDAEVEYLESTGTQYIDTGINPIAN